MAAGELGPQHLDCHLPVVPHVPGEVHRRHSALAELPLDAVAIAEGGGQAVGKCGQVAPGSEVVHSIGAVGHGG